IVGDQIIEQTTLDIDEFSIPERIEVLIDEQVKQLICCGIDKNSGTILKKHGVKVCPSVKGEVDNVLDRFINHNIYAFFG
ncbi:NifB/NifX family molybdenum-iron cluster-binding protein, partial [candidate division KSB1 bacterium]